MTRKNPVDAAVKAFLRFPGAIAIDGVPLENFQVSSAAIRAAIDAYILVMRSDVGETNES